MDAAVLKNDGHNLELADGLLQQERRYIGIRRIPLLLLAEVRSGAPEYLHDQDSMWMTAATGWRCTGRWGLPMLRRRCGLPSSREMRCGESFCHGAAL